MKCKITLTKYVGLLKRTDTGFGTVMYNVQNTCMQDTFARAHTRPRPSGRATIGNLVYKQNTISSRARKSLLNSNGIAILTVYETQNLAMRYLVTRQPLYARYFSSRTQPPGQVRDTIGNLVYKQNTISSRARIKVS